MKIYLIASLFILLATTAYAENYITYKIKVYEKNLSGVAIPLNSQDYSGNKIPTVTIIGSNEPQKIDPEGIAKISLLPSRFPPGKDVKVRVKKEGRYILSPRNSTIRLPYKSENPISIILKARENRVIANKIPLGNKNNFFYYSVQVIATKYPNKAKMIVHSLKQAGFEAYESVELIPSPDKLLYLTTVYIGKYHKKTDARRACKKIRDHTKYKKIFVQKIQI